MANMDYVRIEVSKKTMIRLLATGEVCAADLRCLDCAAKRCLMRLMLQSCRTPVYRQQTTPASTLVCRKRSAQR
jgi:hypothetical protein